MRNNTPEDRVFNKARRACATLMFFAIVVLFCSAQIIIQGEIEPVNTLVWSDISVVVSLIAMTGFVIRAAILINDI